MYNNLASHIKCPIRLFIMHYTYNVTNVWLSMDPNSTLTPCANVDPVAKAPTSLLLIAENRVNTTMVPIIFADLA